MNEHVTSRQEKGGECHCGDASCGDQTGDPPIAHGALQCQELGPSAEERHVLEILGVFEGIALSEGVPPDHVFPVVCIAKLSGDSYQAWAELRDGQNPDVVLTECLSSDLTTEEKSVPRVLSRLLDRVRRTSDRAKKLDGEYMWANGQLWKKVE